jgi:hypothetical protein
MTTVIVAFPVAESSMSEHLTHDECGANEREAMFEMAHFLGYANSARTLQVLETFMWKLHATRELRAQDSLATCLRAQVTSPLDHV